MSRKNFDAEQELFLADFTSVRAEAGRAQDAQQNTLNWSLAGLGALFGGAVLFAAPVLTVPTPRDSAVAIYALIFGLVAPAFGFVSGLAYFGHVRRAERAGAYLRGLEREAAHRARYVPGPLRWQTFLSSNLPGANPILSPQVAVAMLYCGSMLVSGLAFFIGEVNYAHAWQAALSNFGLEGGKELLASLCIGTPILFGVGIVAAMVGLGVEARKVVLLAAIVTPYRDILR